jgi:putative hydrolase of the HAD superfamily
MRSPPVRGEGPRLVLFDLDDTLLDHRGSIRAAFRGLREEYAGLRRVPLHALTTEYSRRLEDAHAAIVRGERSPGEARRERIEETFRLAGVPLAPGELARATRRYRAAYQTSRRLVPGAVGVLRSVGRTARLGILSNNRRSEQLEKIRWLGIGAYFSFVLTSEELPWSKPDPRIFWAAARRGECRPSEATMVGDSWATDIVGAIEAGMAAVWLRRGAEGGPHPPPPVPVLPGFLPLRRAAATIRSARPVDGGGNPYGTPALGPRHEPALHGRR